MAEVIKESKRDAFRKRMAERAPELNMDDEDEYYGYMDNMVSEYDDYRASSDVLRKNLDKSPALTDMLIAAKGKADFDPLVWMVEYEGLDLDALRDDPDYAAKLLEGRRKYLDNLSKKKEVDAEIEANIPRSIDAIKAKSAELGLSDEQAKEILAEIFKMGDELEKGIIPVEVFALLAKGKTRDEDVEMAREEGIAEGLNTKVTDKLRTMPKTTESVGGRQMPVREAKPKAKMSNPFMADYED